MRGKVKEKSDSALFREAMRGVKPLKTDKLPLTNPPPKPIPKQRYLDEALVHEEMLSDNYDLAELETGEQLLFARPGVQHRVLAKLRRGQFSINAELDLHGMIVREARVEVGNFLHDCYNSQIRCARIVHGKGHGSWQKQPILKKKLNKWLQQRDEVLAFCSARSVDGGTGAVYVLIKRK
ncbi:DNA mismatch repair protein MutS [Candidatus Thiomargarita nelsonii]|uniref:DNA mismatch repair protein MutS n=1 Tax=Candidatus Thiomargarita nelsonii TaxID=1003181 RepID=A0A0A6P8I0_9GAMM|nr:DNA mismatch repair protein MutS [Candidatus Thiomargarita nelsonii]